MRNPDANGTHEGLTLAETKESKKGSANMQSHTQPLPNPNKKRDNEANHALLHENAQKAHSTIDSPIPMIEELKMVLDEVPNVRTATHEEMT